MSRRLWTGCSLVGVITFALLHGNVRPIRWANFNAVLYASNGSAPAMPNSANPASGTAGVTVTPTFSWKSAGATSYDLLLGTASPPSAYVSSIATFWYSASQLSAGTTYYWQVVARNSSGTTPGPIWSFRTAGSPVMAAPPGTPPTSSGSTPYSGSPVSLPGLVEAENFDNGGEGVAYHDIEPRNLGGAYRLTEGVDIEPASGGYDVGWVGAGEWLNYTVAVTAAGSYGVAFRVASLGQGGSFHLEMNGANVTGAMTVPNTGGWQNWQTITRTVTLSAGRQIARLVMDANAAYGGIGNFDSFTFSQSAPRPVGGSGPAAPSSPNPPGGTAGVTVTPNLSWKSAGATSYDLLLGTSSPPATYVSNITTSWYSPSQLSAGTNYYWQVLARNGSGTSPGPIWSFTTGGSPVIALPPPSPPPPPSGSGTQISVLTWNIEVNDFTETHARLAVDEALAVNPRPQIITFQEAWSDFFPAYLDELQRRTGQTWYGVYQQMCPPGAWNGSSCTKWWDQIVAIFSTFPIVSTDALYLPAFDCWTSARPALRAAVNVNGTILQVFTTHLQTGGCNNDAQSRYNSMGLLKAWTAKHPAPQLVSGDFNADPDQIDGPLGMAGQFINPSVALGLPKMLTAVSASPTMQLDYWFSDAGGRAQPMSIDVPGNTGSLSDHRPLRATFRLH